MGVEIAVSEAKLQQLMPESLEACTWNQLERQSSELWTVDNEVTLVGSGADKELEQQWLGGCDDREEVERLLQRRVHDKHGEQYRLRWKGFDNTRNSWVKRTNLDCPDLLADFEERRLKRGTPDPGLTDAQAELWYYGSTTATTAKGGQRTSRGPDNEASWRPRSTRHHGTSVFTDQLVTGGGNKPTKSGPDPRIGKGGYAKTRSSHEQETQRFDDARTGPQGTGKGGRGSSLYSVDLDKNPVNNAPSAAYGRWTQGPGKGYGKGGKSAGVCAPTDWSKSFMAKGLADKVEAAANRTNSRRVETVIDKYDNRLVQAAAHTLAFSLAKNTQRAYGGNFNFFLGFCERQGLSPFLDGVNKRLDEATLIQYVMYEWDVHQNTYATIRLKLSAIRSAMMEEGYSNPLEGKYTLDRHLKGIKRMRGATAAKEPLPAEAFRHLLEQTAKGSLMVRATALAFFFLLRVSEFAARDRYHMELYILLRSDVTFWSKGKLCAWNDPNVDAVELHLRGSKTDQSRQGCRRMQQASGDPTLCPVKCMVEWFGLTEGSAIPSNAPLFSIPVGKKGDDWIVLTREAVTLLVKGAATECGVSQRLVGTHSIRISGATALLLAGVAPEVVQIIGRWVSNAFIGYTRYRSELMNGVATSMVKTHYMVRG